jgi:hypothetical protein
MVRRAKESAETELSAAATILAVGALSAFQGAFPPTEPTAASASSKQGGVSRYTVPSSG